MTSGDAGFTLLAGRLAERGVDVEAVFADLRALAIETPSWGYANSGTRFHVFPWPGAARTPWERIADAALVHRLTGACPSVAIHIPWDRVDDFAELRRYAEEQGVRPGAVNPNLFQEDAYRLGSLCHPDPGVRRQALEHVLECVAIGEEIGSADLSLWLADGTNYPGQDDFRERYRRLIESLEKVYAALSDGTRMLVEYKFFEPAFYSTDLPDWGTSLLVCRRLGPKAQVLVDTGHHAQGTNIEQIVAVLLEEGALGGFHFSNRKYADDDLMVGSIDPFELFLIMSEIVSARGDPATAATAARVAFMIDQCHNVEGKIDAMIQSVVNIQSAYAKALIVDREQLREAQGARDVLGAHRVLLDAYETDVRPLLERLRWASRRTRCWRSASAATPSGSLPSAGLPRSIARTSRSDGCDRPLRRYLAPFVHDRHGGGRLINDHHGIGLKLAADVARRWGSSWEVLETIKDALDPVGVANPGKLGL